jgi:hypothetical protein
MLRFTVVFTALLFSFACEEETPCDRYADYICTCHADDPGFDCDALIDLAADPTEATADQCALDLADQKDIDQSEGVECDS